MENNCAFSKDHKCIKWEDYELTRHQLEEADTLCHGNWIEIQRLYVYIDELRSILEENNIDIQGFERYHDCHGTSIADA